MTVTNKRYLVAAIVCLIVLLMVVPIKSTVVPPWRLQVVDINGTPCPNMRVTQSWGHYSLYLDGDNQTDDRLTDGNGYVHFPQRVVPANLPRRLIMPVVTRIATIMHGGWGVSGAVWASGIKDVAWLDYAPNKPLPDKIRVEKCIAAAPNNSLDRSGGSVFRIKPGAEKME